VTVFVGSTRPAKIDGVREALTAIARVDTRFASAVVQAHDVTAVAPRMPMNIGEILAGARQRAAALLALPQFVPATDMAVGVEGGLHQVVADDVSVWTLQTWAAASDGRCWGIGAGPALTLPTEIAERVVAGEELGDVVDGLAGIPIRGTRGAWGLLTCDLIGRRDAFRLAAIAALAPFYNATGWRA